ncbi:hypothetical protein F2Q68_00032437 [Brassica cretica]|uniref:Uncharacterized protein n=1 Tax=Brassica cretica TaxID=69181 RepID=A0A8S9G4F1_BRACR|nr:hypothetical protein F2Q68_00032437 [Brassica cretica]
MPLSGDKFMRPLGPNSSIANQIQTGTTILAANIRSQTRMFPKRRAKTNPLQHRETSSSPRTFQARNAAYERITNLQHRETSQTPEDSFFDEISFLDKNTFLEDQTVIRTNIFSKHILREDSKRPATHWHPLSFRLVMSEQEITPQLTPHGLCIELLSTKVSWSNPLATTSLKLSEHNLHAKPKQLSDHRSNNLTAKCYTEHPQIDTKEISEGQHHTKHGTRMPLSGDKFTRSLGPNSSIANQIQTGTTILAANIRSQTRMFPKRRAKTNPLQHRETSSSPRTFQARNAAYERITNLQHRETSQTPEDSFFDEISFLDKNTFLEDQTVIRTNIFSKHILREDSKR